MARRRFTKELGFKEYKQEAVSLVQQSDIPVAEIARNLGINDNMLRRWVKSLFNTRGFHGKGYLFSSYSGSNLVSNGDFVAGTTGWSSNGSSPISVTSEQMQVS